MTLGLISLRISALSLCGVLVTGAFTACTDSGSSSVPNVGELGDVVDQLRLTRVLDGLAGPTFAAALPGTDTLLVLEQAGLIRRVEAGVLVTEPFLDIRDRVTAGGERGLLGLAFHPQFTENGRFYVHYSSRVAAGTDITAGDGVISEFVRSGQGATADAASERRVLVVEQPRANHNGGMLAFSPQDGFLYIGLGDGGGGGDPDANGQDMNAILGKMLRIDVDGREQGEYGIPAGNMTGNGVRPEIWSYGLRNPWRYSFDDNGDLYIADVGQGSLEEIDYEPAGAGGRNYGWNTMEGTSCYPDGADCERDGLTLPVVEYGRSSGRSITGGYVYRGQAIPDLRGVYLYADYASGLIGALRIEDQALVGSREITATINPDGVSDFTSFGVDSQGEMYLLTSGGALYRIDPR
ncbi:MAG: hypothetical protein RL685_6139 [Pseudomonadota bacterium]|jgi:glucose/arabinose dehydrogenase